MKFVVAFPTHKYISKHLCALPFFTYFMCTRGTLLTATRTATKTAAPTKSRPLTTEFFCGYLQKTSFAQRKSEIHLIRWKEFIHV